MLDLVAFVNTLESIPLTQGNIRVLVDTNSSHFKVHYTTLIKVDFSPEQEAVILSVDMEAAQPWKPQNYDFYTPEDLADMPPRNPHEDLSLSQVLEAAKACLSKYGNRAVYVDVAALAYPGRYAPVSSAGLPLDDQYYEENPEELTHSDFCHEGLVLSIRYNPKYLYGLP